MRKWLHSFVFSFIFISLALLIVNVSASPDFWSNSKNGQTIEDTDGTGMQYYMEVGDVDFEWIKNYSSNEYSFEMAGWLIGRLLAVYSNPEYGDNAKMEIDGRPGWIQSLCEDGTQIVLWYGEIAKSPNWEDVRNNDVYWLYKKTTSFTLVEEKQLNGVALTDDSDAIYYKIYYGKMNAGYGLWQKLTSI